MTEPDWKDAPEWAQWVAMDVDGVWWFHEEEPFLVNEEDWYSEGLIEQTYVPRVPIRLPRPTKEDSSDE